MDYQNTFFHRDFYPTPKSVIDIMMADEDVTDKVVLEPSAGKGDIVKWLIGNGARYVMACEINNDLRKTLTDCDVIGTDFLKVTADQVAACDMIVMNPPFLKGMTHLMHAYEVAPGGCTIVCLLSHKRFADKNLDNHISTHPWTKGREDWYDLPVKERRDIAKAWQKEHLEEYERILEECCSANKRLDAFYETIDLEGSHENIGPVFANDDAERKNEYDIELIKIHKPKTGEDEFDGYIFDEYDKDKWGGDKSGLLPHNKVYELVSRYIDAVNQFDAVEKLSKRINETAGDFSSFRIRFGAHGKDDKGSELMNITRERYKKELQKAAWVRVIKMFNLEKYATNKLREQINTFVEKQTNIPFTMSNIYKMADMIIQTHGQRMESAISEAFDLICQFAPENYDLDEKGRANNRDAWKTNSDYMVNKRFIIPWMISHYCSYRKANMETYGNHSKQFDDVMKALFYLDGTDLSSYIKAQFPDLDLKYVPYSITQVFNELEVEWGKWQDFGWFRIRLYKKGTMHFEFIGEKGEQIWYKFNQTAAKHKGWRIGQTTTAAKKGGGKKKETADSEPAEPIAMPNIISETYENGRFEIVIEAA